MKYLPVMLFTMFSIFDSQAQDFETNNKRMVAYWQMPDVERTETVQSRFREQQWSPGKVKLSSGQVIQAPLIFDQYSNKLYFLQSTQIMEFQQPVEAFTMDLLHRNDTITLLFRSGFPAVNRQTKETFYEVLTEGRFHLLRCKEKTILLQKDQDLPEDRRDYRKEMLYVMTPEKKMIEIKKDKKYLLSVLPGYASEIESTISREKIKVKKEAGLIQLFQALNAKHT